MQRHDVTPRARSRWRWGTPLVSVAIGVAYLIAGWMGGDRQFGVFGLAVMSAVAVIMLVTGRFSETVAGLLDRRDERINMIDDRATLFAGIVVLAAVIVGFIVEIAQGQDGSPYYQLGALGGISYLTGLLVMRFRR